MIQKNAEERSYSLDVLKILATVAIVMHHYQQVTGAHFPGRLNYFGGTFYWGLMVELFFVISGFLTAKYIAKIYSGLRFHSFFLRKARRLLPIMAVAAVCFQIIYFFYYRITR